MEDFPGETRPPSRAENWKEVVVGLPTTVHLPLNIELSTNPDKITNLNSEQYLDSNNIENQAPNKENEKSILSPMPGVFYSSQSPEKPPYVKVGDTIKTGQVLCIIESMKIMNEIESEYNGIIKEIIVNNSDPVEYNQPIFIIEST